MSGESSSAAGWSSRRTPVDPSAGLPRRPDDPRLGEHVRPWDGDLASLMPGRPVLVGFPQGEGGRRNGGRGWCGSPRDEGAPRNAGRPGAAEAPAAVRRWLYRLTPHDLETGADLTR